MSIYDTLNAEQREAVFHTEGPLLILAGAGSGKTRVLTHRIAYLIEEKGINPWNILAITFTNKAAGEMRERVDDIVGFGSESIWVSTFHSTCVRILRRHIDRLGYDNNFTIYDSDDQKTLMKDVCKLLQIDTKTYRERMILSAISSAKDEMVTPEEYELNAYGDFSKKKIAEAYKEYERQLKANNALDFDDLLVKTVQLFQTQPEILEYYQDRFRYIMVDEYQDTNTVQFKLISLLAAKYKNLCVVGDDDQSIYKFRGANIQNILSFEKEFEHTKVIKLEQNYRSTSTILDAANAVIKNNVGRKAKSLWTENGEGEKIQFRQFDTAYDEAEYIVGDIRERVDNGKAAYCDHAVLYRTNAQSRLFEEKMITANIPYKIVGGVNFYARKEIKDLLAYLKTIDNGKDDLAVRRIINVPKRGIGLTTVNRITEAAQQRGISFYEALCSADLVPGLGRSISKLESFAAMIEYFRKEAEHLSITELMKEILTETGYVEELKAEGEEEAEVRLQNIDEFLNKIAAYEESCEEELPTLSGFLEEVALVADIDSLDEESDYVVLMTLHSAKGLEFPYVYLAGMEDGIFPSYMTITADDPTELEEERRLCYVGITRAKKELSMTCARRRMIRGETQYNKMSRFLKEVPPQLLSTGKIVEKEELELPKQNAYVQAKQSFQAKPFMISKPVQQFGVKSGEGLSYGVGDRVRHMKFGEGTVTAITEGGRDYEVSVDFDSAGTKKMFASFAKLQKV
ncbi:DNA helicase-2/ATP-dependent DNA helicase PcrA [Faecalimonas umbilicata]|uniref:ATP-dependent DNA helicase n=1 Tax=Faecalimonas umbilicata TaxID=1912855 RepID=A0A4R3J9B6_9FIRM|nr:DNA helicase PcrA [Faecalimonas umbilicata]MDY2761337.1 DNA helicase PcrA [Faecalimonas umbilicata]TCS61576.1 DNA helicase-2/ATP-dependent DNA helicase PcrA [Faecalimonas umbilicata]GBU05474.1 DNA helicase [Faecalimonas umbilicata]